MSTAMSYDVLLRPTQRTYAPGCAELRECLVCDLPCLPFPHKHSVVCSWCWWEINRPGGENHEPA